MYFLKNKYTNMLTNDSLVTKLFFNRNYYIFIENIKKMKNSDLFSFIKRKKIVYF